MSIEEICDKYNIRYYTINDDNSIDVDDHVFLGTYDLSAEIGYLDELPLNFNKVTGDFYCNEHVLTTLKGSPKWVGGSFYCNDNALTSLEYSPVYVGESFHCSSNRLIDLKFSPESVGNDFNCTGNILTSLEGSPYKVGGDFRCTDNKLTDLKGCPEEVGGSFWFANNKIYDLKEFPKSVGGQIGLKNNPIGSIFQFNDIDIDIIKAFNTFKVLKDGVINLKRLRYVIYELFGQFIYLHLVSEHYKIKK